MLKYVVLILISSMPYRSFCQGTCVYNVDSIMANYKKNFDTLLSKFKEDSFIISYSKKDIPGFIKKELKCLNNNFDLANPGQKYDATDVRTRGNPTRQLIFMATSANLFVITYNHGGFGWHKHILIALFKGDEISSLWTSQALGDLNTLTQVINYLKDIESTKRGSDYSYTHI